MAISLNGEVPIYQQIIDLIKNQILSGELQAGQPISSIRTLANELGVSVITIKRAYNDLEILGFIKAIPAKGFFVSTNNIENMREIAIAKIEKELDSLICSAKAISLSKEDFLDIIDVLYDEIN